VPAFGGGALKGVVEGCSEGFGVCCISVALLVVAVVSSVACVGDGVGGNVYFG
jgi:hypothetical protein